MPKNVAIIASGQTNHTSRRKDVNIPEMIREAVDRALTDAELTIDDIDAVVIGNMEHFEGINLSDMWASEGSGAVMKPCMKIATGGTTGTSVAAGAYYHCASGLFDTVLAIGWEKLSESDTTAGIITAFDPIVERLTLAGAIGGLAIEANLYMTTYGLSQEHFAKAAVMARKNAQNNPHAHLKHDLTVEMVLNSPMIAYPIHYLDMCPTSDGACAVIFASEDRARRLCPRPAWIKAAVCRHNHPYIGDVWWDRSTLESAAIEAYKIAGITNPRKELDVIELYDPASYALVAWIQHLHICGPGEGGKLIDDGSITMEGDIPVNPSGGVISTNPIGATALIRVAEAALQIQGKAGARQVEGAKTALATGFGGSYWNEVFILSDRL
ncbi:MAG: thiolase family protein [Acidobacteriota bacterium]|nr:thiolase family protein [Blastocatellia bacterium]MDW8241326.1 thiolase family protein [Acidobacteriota bacterium]